MGSVEQAEVPSGRGRGGHRRPKRRPSRSPPRESHLVWEPEGRSAVTGPPNERRPKSASGEKVAAVVPPLGGPFRRRPVRGPW